MKLNKAKRGLELGAAIPAFFYCIIDLILEFITLDYLIAEINARAGLPYFADWQSTILAYIIVVLIGVALVIVELVLACKLFKKPIIIDDKYARTGGYDEDRLKKRKGVRICFIVFSSILAHILFINLFMGMTYVAIAELGFLCFVTAVVLESIAMSMKEFKEEKVEPISFGIDAKIAELKHLRELGVIDEEQYKNAVEKNIKDII